MAAPAVMPAGGVMGSMSSNPLPIGMYYQWLSRNDKVTSSSKKGWWGGGNKGGGGGRGRGGGGAKASSPKSAAPSEQFWGSFADADLLPSYDPNASYYNSAPKSGAAPMGADHPSFGGGGAARSSSPVGVDVIASRAEKLASIRAKSEVQGPAVVPTSAPSSGSVQGRYDKAAYIRVGDTARARMQSKFRFSGRQAQEVAAKYNRESPMSAYQNYMNNSKAGKTPLASSPKVNRPAGSYKVGGGWSGTQGTVKRSPSGHPVPYNVDSAFKGNPGNYSDSPKVNRPAGTAIDNAGKRIASSSVGKGIGNIINNVRTSIGNAGNKIWSSMIGANQSGVPKGAYPAVGPAASRGRSVDRAVLQHQKATDPYGHAQNFENASPYKQTNLKLGPYSNTEIESNNELFRKARHEKSPLGKNYSHPYGQEDIARSFRGAVNHERFASAARDIKANLGSGTPGDAARDVGGKTADTASSVMEPRTGDKPITHVAAGDAPPIGDPLVDANKATKKISKEAPEGLTNMWKGKLGAGMLAVGGLAVGGVLIANMLGNMDNRKRYSY